MHTITAERKMTATHLVSLSDDGRADGRVAAYVVATRKLRNEKPFGPTHCKSFASLDDARAAFAAR